MIPSSFFESHPKNVCPSCGERAEWKRSFESGRPGFNTLFACQSCGATCRQCEIRYLTDEERAESAERQRESKRERARAATPEERHEAYERSRGRTLRLIRERRKADPEYAEKLRERSRRYYRANRKREKERHAKYYRENREEILLKKNLANLRKLSERKERG